MQTEDVLAAYGACRVGVWRWNGRDNTVDLDAVAAELLGLAAEPVSLPESTLRARFHVTDYLQSQRHLRASIAEGRVGEAQLRVISEDGSRLRTIRTRVGPSPGHRGADLPPHLFGTFSEMPEGPVHSPSLVDPDQVEWQRAREAFVLDVGQALTEAHTTREVLTVATSLGMPGFTPSATGVFSRVGDMMRMVEYRTRYGDPESDKEAMEAIRREMPEQLRSMDADHPAVHAMRNGQAVYLHTPGEFEEAYPELWPWMATQGGQSWAYLPLIVAGRTIGVWLLTFDSRMEFSFDERALLSTIGRLLAQALARAFLHDTERELSADLQHTMRPAPTPTIPGMVVAARYVPTGGGLRIGGDWYDVIPLPSGRFALIIGDVQGHDVRAAAIMAQLRIALRAYASEGHHPDAVLSRATRFLATLAPTAGTLEALPDDRFATCLYVEVDPPSGTLNVARAGHPDPAMLLEDGTLVTRPTVGGLPLGIYPSGDYPITRLALEPGETLMLCTDGLIEAGHRGLDAGWQRLRNAVGDLVSERDAAEPPDLQDVADALLDAAQGGGAESGDGLDTAQTDDMALLLLKRPQSAARELGLRGPVRRVMLTIAQSEPARIGQARRQLDALLHDWQDADRVYGAEVMLSEVVTNVLTHTDGDALLVAELSGQPGNRMLRVEVTDPSDELPHRREPGELASSGRGLMLMESLSDAWGVAPRGEGKTTWFELREVESGGPEAGDPREQDENGAEGGEGDRSEGPEGQEGREGREGRERGGAGERAVRGGRPGSLKEEPRGGG